MKIKLEYDKNNHARLIEFEGTLEEYDDFNKKHLDWGEEK